MQELGEDQEDRTRGFVPPEPRGIGVRWIAVAAVVVLGAVFVVSKILPASGDSKPASTVQQPSVK